MQNKVTKYIFITGGVVSGLGKGIAAASLGRLLKERGLKISAVKLDPYMNVDPGTMSPFQHGEVFVTDDGTETDLDLGHYERFIDESLTKHSNLTSGQVYSNVLTKERAGEYLGKTVQVIPHVTQEIKDFICRGKEKVDICLVEIGGTIGDIEGQPFIEAIRQISVDYKENCLFMHVTLVPYLKSSGEHKTKPTQRSVRDLMSMGISPDIIIARADEPLGEGIKEKIALFCNVKEECVIETITASSLYQVPLILQNQGLDDVVCKRLGITTPKPQLNQWESMVKKIKDRQKTVEVAIVGKYVTFSDAYLSIIESLNHAGFELGTKVNIHWVESDSVLKGTESLQNVDAILIPGGFGIRGIEGKIIACKYARENNIPFLGICLGMQIAVIEFARNVCGLDNANSKEFDQDAKHPVIDIMESQIGKEGSGGTMRLGTYPCKLEKNSVALSLYKEDQIDERHRHRFEFNNQYRTNLSEKGLVFSGMSPDNNLVEIVEIPDNDFFVAVQFHPEFKSRPNKPHPLFLGFLKSAIS